MSIQDTDDGAVPWRYPQRCPAERGKGSSQPEVARVCSTFGRARQAKQHAEKPVTSLWMASPYIQYGQQRPYGTPSNILIVCNSHEQG